MNFDQVISVFIGYLFGCFQTSYFVSKWVKKEDIRELGSGNAGASNVTSELGWSYGIFTGIIDVLKAYIPVQIILFIFPQSSPDMDLILMALAGTGAILGHIYPFYMDFRGGKGIACYIGILLAFDWHIGLATIIILIVLTIITDYISIGSIVLYLAVPTLAYYTGDYPNIVIGCSLILLIVGLVKHRINIQRIMNGTEKGLRSVLRKEK